MLPARRCMSSTWAKSSTTSPTPSKTRAATPSSSNGATTTSPGALTKWLRLKNKLHRCAPPQLPLSSIHPAQIQLPRTSFPLLFALQRIIIYSTCTKKACEDICLQFSWRRLSRAKKFCINSRNCIYIQNDVKATVWFLWVPWNFLFLFCRVVNEWCNTWMSRHVGSIQQYLSVMQYGFVWFKDEKLTFFCYINLFLVSLCRPNKDLMANFPDESDWIYLISRSLGGPFANSTGGISYFFDFNSFIMQLFSDHCWFFCLSSCQDIFSWSQMLTAGRVWSRATISDS